MSFLSTALAPEFPPRPRSLALPLLGLLGLDLFHAGLYNALDIHLRFLYRWFRVSLYREDLPTSTVLLFFD